MLGTNPEEAGTGVSEVRVVEGLPLSHLPELPSPLSGGPVPLVLVTPQKLELGSKKRLAGALSAGSHCYPPPPHHLIHICYFCFFYLLIVQICSRKISILLRLGEPGGTQSAEWTEGFCTLLQTPIQNRQNQAPPVHLLRLIGLLSILAMTTFS